MELVLVDEVDCLLLGLLGDTRPVLVLSASSILLAVLVEGGIVVVTIPVQDVADKDISP